MSSPPSRASSSSSSSSRLYQIDFTAVQAGKYIASSKRRVRWRFGFANARALQDGLTGTAARGSEHEVTFVWSITSGKCLVLQDGKEIHFSTSRASIFDYSWTMKGNHILKIVAHAAPPLSQTPNFRQYDLFVNGQSFFTFPKVFRLGLAPGQIASPDSSGAMMAERGERHRRRGQSSDITNLEAPNNPDEEEAYLQEAIRQSLQDGKPISRTKSRSASEGAVTAAPAGGVSDLLDFGPSPSSSTATGALALTSPASDGGGGSFHTQPRYSYGGVTAATGSFAAASGAAPPAPANPFGYGPPSQHSALWTSSTSLPAFPSPATHGAPAPAPMATGATDPWASSSSMISPPQTSLVSTATETANGYFGTASPANGYGPPQSSSTSLVPSAHANQQQSSWALPAPSQPPQAPYGAPPASGGAAWQPSPNQASQIGQPPNAASQQWNPPPPIQTHYVAAPANPFGDRDAGVVTQEYGTTLAAGVPPEVITPQAQPATPSTIGFMSPAAAAGVAPSADYPGFASPAPVPEMAPPTPAEPAAAPALLSMSALASFDDNNNTPPPASKMMPLGASSSLADEAMKKLINMDTFSVMSKNDASRAHNPFEMSSTVGASQSLADMKTRKASAGPVKPIMNAPVPAAQGAMVVSSSAQNGSPFGSAYGMMSQQPPPPYSYSSSAPPVGQQAAPQPQPPFYGGPVPMQQQQSQQPGSSGLPASGGPPPAQSHQPYFGQHHQSAPVAQQPAAAYGQQGFGAALPSPPHPQAAPGPYASYGATLPSAAPSYF